VLAFVIAVDGQSSRPRRVTTPPPDTLLGPEPKAPPATDKNAPLLDVKPSKPVGSAPVSSDTTHAFQLFQQKQYAPAAKEAKQIAASDPGMPKPGSWQVFLNSILSSTRTPLTICKRLSIYSDAPVRKIHTPSTRLPRAMSWPKNMIARCRCS